MMRALRWLGIGAAAAALAFGVLVVVVGYQDGPLGPIPGGPFSEATSDPAQLDVASAGRADTIAIEVGEVDARTRTVWVLEYDGRLYVPSLGASYKRWPGEAAAARRIRARIGDRVYAFRVARVQDDFRREALFVAMEQKYGSAADPGELRDGTWFFELTPEPPRAGQG